MPETRYSTPTFSMLAESCPNVKNFSAARFLASLQPFIACLTAYAKTSTQRAHVSIFIKCKSYEFQSQRHGIHFLPGHRCPPLWSSRSSIYGESIMTLLDVYHTWKVLPMSSYMCYLCPQSIQKGAGGFFRIALAQRMPIHRIISSWTKILCFEVRLAG